MPASAQHEKPDVMRYIPKKSPGYYKSLTPRRRADIAETIGTDDDAALRVVHEAEKFIHTKVVPLLHTEERLRAQGEEPNLVIQEIGY